MVAFDADDIFSILEDIPEISKGYSGGVGKAGPWKFSGGETRIFLQ